MSFKSFKTLFSFKSLFLSLILIVFIIGLIDYTIIREKNGCEMTYMFQIPQFVSIPLKNQITLKYPNYNLYAYGEGQYSESLRNGNFNGIPVLFVPGNRGSYKQVRSLGSVALRWSDRYGTRFRMNYFAVDFNEEYSGINSFKLQSQTDFLKECVIKIINLYKTRGRDVSLIIIGHSIGGLIIRSLLTLPELEPFLKKVDLIITLATPHTYPVVPIDSKMSSFYKRVEDFWKSNRNESLSHINVISIGGGFNDKLVRSHLTKLSTNHTNDLSTVTTAIDDVWVSTDHLCIVWCKQLVLKITRLLFDLIDEKTLQIMTKNSDRNRIIRYHLMGRTLGKSYPKILIPEYISFTPFGDWSENFERVIKISKPKVLNSTNILIPFMRRENIVIQFEGIYRSDWIIACNPVKQNNITFCEKGLNLYPYVKRMPSETNDIERRVFKGVSNHFLTKGFSHLLLAISPTVEPVNIQIDRFTSSIRSKTIIMPSLLQSLTMIFSPVTILNIAISEETTFYDLSLVGLNQIWNTYWIRFDTISCYPSASNIGYLYFSIPWNKENQFKYVYPKKGKTSEMTLKLNSPKPKHFDETKEPTLYLLIDPNCSYKLHLKPSISEIVGQILRHFGVILVPMIVSIVLSVLSIQINAKQWIGKDSSNGSKDNDFFVKKCKYLFQSPIESIKNFLLVSNYGLLVMSSSAFAIHSNYTETNSMTSSLSDTQIIFLYLFLFLTALSITYFFFIIITFLFFSLSTVLVYLQTKFTSSQSMVKEIQEKSFRFKLIPTLCLILLAIIGITTISALTFLICLFLHNIQLIYLSKTCRTLEDRSGVNTYSSQINIHLTLLSLLYLSSIPTIPLLLDWINLKMPFLSLGLEDPYLIPALILSVSCPVIWHQYSVWDININQRKYLSFVLKLISIISSVICQMNYSNISFIITLSLITVSVQQLSEWFRNRHLKSD